MQSTLSVRRLASPGRDLPARRKWQGPGRHILVAEDDATVRVLTTTILMRAGFKVTVATDGAAAWDLLSRQSFDLLLTDNEMPKLRGLELIDRVRAAGLTLPVVLMSGGALPEESVLRSHLRPGIAISKPFTSQGLISVICRQLMTAPDQPRLRLLTE